MNTGEKFSENMSYREYRSPQRQSRERREGRKHNYNKSGVIISAPDRQLLVIVAFLVVLGLLAIFSATAPKCQREGVLLITMAFKQGIYEVVGYVAMLFFSRFDYKRLEKYNTKFMWTVIFLLLILQFTPLGVVINGAKRWINLGFMQLQPSELAKPLFCMLLATMFKDKISMETLKNFASKYIWQMVFILGLIYKQPNLSMVLILLATTGILYLIAMGPLLPVYCMLGVGGVGALSFLPKLLRGYQMDRITIWLNPGSDALGKGYNIIQSLIAFATGGIMGSGYGGSIQKLAYLPECHTDFIFAIIAEEFGLLGCLFVIGLFAALVLRGMWVAKRCPDMYGKLLAAGITFIFGLQALFNMSVASSLMPVTGVTLPFISYGGTSIIVSLAMIGILLNISRQRIKSLGTQTNE